LPSIVIIEGAPMKLTEKQIRKVVRKLLEIEIKGWRPTAMQGGGGGGGMGGGYDDYGYDDYYDDDYGYFGDVEAEAGDGYGDDGDGDDGDGE
jgi:hypothetical protein